MLRQRLAVLLEPQGSSHWSGRLVDWLLILLIAANVVAVILESVSWFAAEHRQALLWFERVSVLIFTLEYGLRIWCAPDTHAEQQDLPPLSPGKARWRYLRSPMALVDLIAIVPFYLSVFFSLDLRFLRVLRLLRVFKLTRYSAAMQMLLGVFREEAGPLGAAFFVLFILMILASSGIYLIEHQIQPEAFGSIPAAMWWAMATLTTVGYGDVTPITPLGRFFGGCITLVGMGMVALPAGILASGFSDQLHRRRQEYQQALSEALEDGHMSHSEASELEELRQELGLSESQVTLLQQKWQRRQHRCSCPHCGAELP
ncbi:ion transporter [Balneatrix alpica]|uniref:Ion transporter n=1 Tax=Balneatrix alpica TaxID=75684 RepID=A0ABV5Z7L3_9GAMM|nr:ion transporter [Balneatrix alpica]